MWWATIRALGLIDRRARKVKDSRYVTDADGQTSLRPTQTAMRAEIIPPTLGPVPARPMVSLSGPTSGEDIGDGKMKEGICQASKIVSDNNNYLRTTSHSSCMRLGNLETDLLY